MTKPKILENKNIRQFLSYAVVGLVATLVEWGLFWLLTFPLSLDQNLAFTIAFIISTFVNLVLGKKMTFKNAEIIHASSNKKLNLAKETFLIYLVAVIGYVLNLALLNIFTAALMMNKMPAKMLATVIVFFWNYLARRLGIYRSDSKKTEKAI